MSVASEAIIQSASEARKDKAKFEELLQNLEGSSRRLRQTSASILAQIAREEPELLLDHVNALIDGLNRPEAQTRWECLDALSELVVLDSRVCDKALSGAENALFDEDSGPARLAAVRFLCRLGATTENRSEKVWPLLNEAIQCYHGDFEFQEMLGAVTTFSSGKLSAHVKEELKKRMSFDAENAKGALKRRATQIVENLS